MVLGGGDDGELAVGVILLQRSMTLTVPRWWSAWAWLM